MSLRGFQLVEKLQQPRLLFWRRFLPCGRPSLSPVPHQSPRNATLSFEGAPLLPRGKKYFNIYLKVSPGKWNFSNRIMEIPDTRFRAALRVFSLSTSTWLHQSTIEQDEFQREEGNFRKIRTRSLGRRNSINVKLVGFAKFGSVGRWSCDFGMDTVKGEALWRSV